MFGYGAHRLKMFIVYLSYSYVVKAVIMCWCREEKTRDKAVRLLISKGADVNLRDENERTALSYACETRCNDIVKILVKNNVDPGLTDRAGN